MSARNKKRLVIGGCVLAAAIGGGAIAYAEWSGSAVGQGHAQATTTVQATLNPANGAPDLYPGFTDGDVYFTVTNPNAFGITYTDMTPEGIESSDDTACPATNVTIEPATGLNLISPPNATSETLSVADVVSMDADAPDGCQGMEFLIDVTLTGAQTSQGT